MAREPENQKDVATGAPRKEKTAEGTERQVNQAEKKDKVTGAW